MKAPALMAAGKSSTGGLTRMAPLERPLPALPLPPAQKDCCSEPPLPPVPELPVTHRAQGAACEQASGGPVASPAEITLRVQAWMAAGTPRLVMELSGAWGGRVDVERTGPGRVRVRWQGQRASARTGLARRLQQALMAAGLGVDGLSVTD